MAKLEVNFDGGLFEQLNKLENVEEIATKMIDAALPILMNALRAAYGSFRIAGRLKIVKAKAARGGGYIGTVTPTGSTGHYYKKGKQKYPLSFGGLAVFLEFGTGKKGNFPPTPAGGYIARAVAASQGEVQAKMQQVFEQEVGGT